MALLTQPRVSSRVHCFFWRRTSLATEENLSWTLSYLDEVGFRTEKLFKHFCTAVRLVLGSGCINKDITFTTIILVRLIWS